MHEICNNNNKNSWPQKRFSTLAFKNNDQIKENINKLYAKYGENT